MIAPAMIRTSSEAPFFGLWRDAKTLCALAHAQFLTTARFEPILRRHQGGGHIDLLFEAGRQSCVLGGIQLDPIQLIKRERSPFIWPASIAAAVGHNQLSAIEQRITPWLRAMARARAMATESIRHYAASARFDRARSMDLFGAAPLDRSMLRMAPFLYARRFASNAHVLLACAHSALASAVLADVAAVIEEVEAGGDDDIFARGWYGVGPVQRSSSSRPDIVIVNQRGDLDAAIVVETNPTSDSLAAIVDVPSPAPWDLLFSFDVADAPAASLFGIYAVEPALRECKGLQPPGVVGGSSGTIVLAVSAEAQTMRGADIEEVEAFGRRLVAEGFFVRIVSEPSDSSLADAQLVHIFGASCESHTIAFAERALQRGVAYVFDLPPRAADTSAFLETTFYRIYHSSREDAERARYVSAYERRELTAPPDPNVPAEPTAAEYARIEARFAELALRAAALLTVEEDVDALRIALPSEVADRISARGGFLEAEPVAGAIGHLVPSSPFALMHAPIAQRSHLLYAAISAERARLPVVITGSVHDVVYLQVLRASAPSAIVLADADAQTISALYRRAAIWVDAATRPRSAAAMFRAVACGALPVLADQSPLARMVNSEVPTFSLVSVDACRRVMIEAMARPDRSARISALQARLSYRCDSASTFGSVMAAYSRAAAMGL